MNGVRWVACLWPGLPQLWLQGRWSALSLAIGFSLVLNTAMTLSFVWPQWVSAPARTTLWTVVAIAWFGSTLTNLWNARAGRSSDRQTSHSDPFTTALNEYLKGHWIEAENLLVQLLRRDPADADARLLLATLQRHTGRLEEARETLRRMERYESAVKWELEIRNERQRLDECENKRRLQASESDDENTNRSADTTDESSNNIAA